MSFLDSLKEWFCNIIHHDDYIEVEVVRGDTLWSICERASGAKTNAEVLRHVEEVRALNPGIDPDLIHPGDKIRLPVEWGK